MAKHTTHAAIEDQTPSEPARIPTARETALLQLSLTLASSAFTAEQIDTLHHEISHKIDRAARSRSTQ